MSKSEKKLKVIPLGDRVLVKPSYEKQSEKTKSGIYIPESANKETPEQGKVIAVGEGKYDDGVFIPLNVKVGDTVIFSKYGYDEVSVADEKYFILKQDSILAVIK